MSAVDPQNESEELLARLRPELPVAELLGAFRELGLRPAHIREAVGVTPEALRLWAKDAPVRQSNRVVVENIARAATTLLRAAGSPAEAVQWLTAVDEATSGVSPLRLVREQPDAVLAAAEEHAAGRFTEEREFLRQAAENQQQAADLDASGTSGEPTEVSSTQEKGLLLARLHEKTLLHASAREVMEQLDSHHGSSQPNYIAYDRLVEQVRKALEEAKDEPAQVVIAPLLADALAEEESLRKEFGRIGEELVNPGCTILTYSLSMRVIHALWGVDKAKQETCKLYVAEGRVKSLPRSGELPAFADAAEILRSLKSTRYDRYIVPDALAASMVAKGRVDLVMLGAQKVFCSEGRYTDFIATAGTDAILRTARAKNVKVVVFAEEEKVVKGRPAVDGNSDVEPHERIVPVSLPPAPGEESGGHGRLMMFSAELCNVDSTSPESIGDPLFEIPSEKKEQRAVPAAA